ncbi:hypothetical protein FACS1894191_0430 [Clostridia bacterium]|nr:hypothetical protein FACS1894191_0430 [Clostridia bacterium]
MGDKMSLKRFLSLYGVHARMDLDWLLRDTRIALLAIIADLVSNLAAVSGVFLLAWRFDGVGGMSRWDVLVMLGYVTCVTGLFTMFCSGNNGHISRIIGRGQWDHMITQPLPYPVQLLTMGFIPFTGCQNLLCGIGIEILALHGLGLTPGPVWWLCLTGYLLVSLAIILGLMYLFSSLAFWKPVACEEIASDVELLTDTLSKYPLSGMPAGIQTALVSVLPAGLLGWFPVCVLLGKAPLGLPAIYPLIIAAVIWAFAALAFRKGLNYYVKIGSNRYLPMGHRR